MYIILFFTAAVISLHDHTRVSVCACSPHSLLSHLTGFVAAVEYTFTIPIRQAWPEKQFKYLNKWLCLKFDSSDRLMFSYLLTRK